MYDCYCYCYVKTSLPPHPPQSICSPLVKTAPPATDAPQSLQVRHAGWNVRPSPCSKIWVSNNLEPFHLLIPVDPAQEDAVPCDQGGADGAGGAGGGLLVLVLVNIRQTSDYKPLLSN